MQRLHLLFILVSGTLLLQTGCKSSKTGDKPKPKPSPVEKAETPEKPAVEKPKTIALDIPKDKTFASVEFAVEFLDPNLITEASGTRIGRQLFEQLVTIAPGNPSVVGAGAVSWESSNNGAQYTFELRKDAKWSDGKALTSADWMYSFERALNPNTGSRNAQQYWIIKNAQAYNKGDITDFSQVGI